MAHERRLILSKALTAALLVLVGMVAVHAPPAFSTEAAWARVVSGGYTILLRHARTLAPADRPGATVGDCTTQNNLSDRGRQQASRIGVRFAARATPISRVYTSQYCSAIDTADLAFGSYDAEELEGLNPVAEGDEAGAQFLRDLVGEFAGPGNQVIITHPENISALIGKEPREGEAIILAPAAEAGADPRIVGRILLD